TAADIIKRAMIAVHRWLEDSDDGTLMLMQVHDELVFEVAEQCIQTYQQRIAELMTSAAELSIKLDVDAGVGDNWHEAH
ncbi:MAG: hypothetical protein GY770_34000, partial [Aestuariibacter sp.]|nr:hypothetical protein [Aestuariibacter sp.]